MSRITTALLVIRLAPKASLERLPWAWLVIKTDWLRKFLRIMIQTHASPFAMSWKWEKLVDLFSRKSEIIKWPHYSFLFLLLKMLSALVPRVPTHCCPKFNPMSSETWIRTQPLHFLSSSKTTRQVSSACRRDTKFSAAESLRKISSKLTQDDDIVFN